MYTTWDRVRRLRVLPVAGGMIDQAKVFLEAVDVLESAWARAETRETRSIYAR